MDPAAVIESYVEDVARRVPRAERNDVAMELRTLLGEELQARAAGAGRAPDEAMALDILSRFGRPEDVAELYGPPGLVIIKPAAGRAFAWTALIGVGVQWALTLPAAFARAPGGPGGEPLTLFARWWLTWGVGAFWFPGFMVVGAIFAAWVAERWPRPASWAPRRVIDRDRVNRPLLGLGLVAWAAYMVLLALEPALVTRLPQPVAAAFTFDDGFLASRGPWLFPIWGPQLVIYVAVLVQGRWRRRTRELNALASAALCALLAWFVATGPIFRAKPTDDLTKALICAIVLVTLISLGVTLYRQVGRSGLPKVAASA